MTKRPPPFETGICRQSKIHVNNYENDLNAQKDLEERTLRKLLEGSKKLHSIVLLNQDPQTGACKGNLTQKCVTNYFTVNGGKTNRDARKVINLLEVPSQCSFCDLRGLTYQCSHCLEFYCSSCSFAKYEFELRVN